MKINKMKKLIQNYWACRSNIGYAWLFFFCLSLAGKTPHGPLYLLLISGLTGFISVNLGRYISNLKWFK